MTASAGGTIPRRDLLLAVAEELGDLSASATSLQATLGEVIEGASGDGPGHQGLWHMQEIDRLQQTLDDLHVILRQAAEDDGQQHLNVENLVAVARLGALRDRLRGRRPESAAGQEPGIVALF